MRYSIKSLCIISIVLFGLITFVSTDCVSAAENSQKIVPVKGDGFATRHDEKIYGEQLVPRKIEGSLPTSDLVLNGNWLYATGQGHLTVYDVTDPVNPKETVKLFGIVEGRQIEFYKNNLYITARTGGLYIVDVEQPRHPRLRAHYDTIELATGIKCVNDRAYVCQRQFGTEIIDITDPSNPKHLNFVLSGEAQSVDCVNGILYAGDWGSSQLTVIDVRNIKNPQIIGSAKLDGLGDGVFVLDNICYASTGIKPTKTAKKTGMKNVTGHGLDIFSLVPAKREDREHLESPGTNPENRSKYEDNRKESRKDANVGTLNNPKLIGRIKFPVQAKHTFPDFWSVSVNEQKMAYCADSYNGLFCVDVSDPTHPKSLAWAILPICEKNGNPDPVGAVEAGDGVLYAAGCYNGIYVVPAEKIAKRISAMRTGPNPDDYPIPNDPPKNVELLRDFDLLETGGQTLAAAVRDNQSVWVAAGRAGIMLVDINSNPPRIRSVTPTRGFAYDVKTDGKRLFTAEGTNGFAVYRITQSEELVPIGRFDCGSTVRQLVLLDPKRLLVTKSGNSVLTFFDITDPSLPKKVFRDIPHTGILYGRDFVDGTVQGSAVCVSQMTGLRWYDLSGEVPKLKTISFPTQVSFANGACWLKDKLIFFRKGGYYICDINESRPLTELTFHTVKDLTMFGKANAKGKEICFTDRRNGAIFFIDVSDINAPKVVRKYTLHAHPELAVFTDNRAIIPAGYSGLLIEKVKKP